MPRRFKLRKKQLVSLLSLVVALVIYILQQQGMLSGVEQSVETNQPGSYSIHHYVDGDTIAVNMDGKVETIRFIGIDTPETHKPNTPVQCYGPAAAAHTKNVIAQAGGKVRLVADSLSSNRDRYNRLLRYVYLPDGTNVNELNVREGYAFYYPYFPFTKSDAFAVAQQAAKSKNLGLWGNCTPTPTDNGGYKMEQSAAQST